MIATDMLRSTYESVESKLYQIVRVAATTQSRGSIQNHTSWMWICIYNSNFISNLFPFGIPSIYGDVEAVECAMWDNLQNASERETLIGQGEEEISMELLIRWQFFRNIRTSGLNGGMEMGRAGMDL